MTRKRGQHGPHAPFKTDAELAKQFRISRARVMQIRLRAMEKLRQAIIDDPELADLAMEVCGFDVVARERERSQE